MNTLFDSLTPVTDEVLAAVAHMPTASLLVLLNDAFARRLSDADLMCIAVLLAKKSYDEGGCPIGAVIVDNVSAPDCWEVVTLRWCRRITPTTTARTTCRSVMPGELDFSRTTLFTSLSPCDVCARLAAHARFCPEVVVGRYQQRFGH